MVKFAFVASILSAVPATLAAAVATASMATSALEERAAPVICGEQTTNIAAVVTIFEDDYIFPKELSNVITLTAGYCVKNVALGKGASVAWSKPDVLGKLHYVIQSYNLQ